MIEHRSQKHQQWPSTCIFWNKTTLLHTWKHKPTNQCASIRPSSFEFYNDQASPQASSVNFSLPMFLGCALQIPLFVKYMTKGGCQRPVDKMLTKVRDITEPTKKSQTVAKTNGNADSPKKQLFPFRLGFLRISNGWQPSECRPPPSSQG